MTSDAREMLRAGVTSENVAERYGISRQQQDEMAARSHKRAAAARASGRFKDEIVPVKTVWKDKSVRRWLKHLHSRMLIVVVLSCLAVHVLVCSAGPPNVVQFSCWVSIRREQSAWVRCSCQKLHQGSGS